MDTNIQTETDKAYARLHQAIVQGELSPNQRLVELELAAQLGVGRAAIRTALVRLTQDGLVVHVPNRGAQVRHIARAEAVEMLEARAVLEGLAVRYAARHATEPEIAELRALVERMKQWIDAGDLLAYSDINAQLHAKLVSMANHRTVTLLLARLQANHVLYQYRMIMMPERAAQSLLEHGALVEAVAAHDEDAAEVAMRQHLSHSAEELRKSIESITRDGVAP